jgi:hypothetical protein
MYVKARLGELRLQKECAPGNNPHTWLHTPDHGEPGHRPHHFDLAWLKLTRFVFDKYLPVTIRATQYRIVWYGKHLFRSTALNAGLDKQSWVQPVIRIGTSIRTPSVRVFSSSA